MSGRKPRVLLAVVGSLASGGAALAASLELQPRVVAVQEWRAGDHNRTLIHGVAAAGVAVTLDDYQLPRATDQQGRFQLLVDHTVLRRRIMRSQDGSRAWLDIVFPVRLQVRRGAAGDVLTGRARFQDGRPAPPVVLYAYRLTGVIRDDAGAPVEGAVVGVSKGDNAAISDPTGMDGRYVLDFLPGSDREGFQVSVLRDGETWRTAGPEVMFEPLKSARMDIDLAHAGMLTGLHPASEPGAVYEGLLVGAQDAAGQVILPIAASWADRTGQFSVTYPAGGLRGPGVRYFQQVAYVFHRTPALPGGAVDLASWPRALSLGTPAGLPPDLSRIMGASGH